MSAALGTVERRGTLALAEREVRRVLSLWTQTILPSAVSALLFLAIFGGVLGERIRRLEGLEYATFILPGLIVMTAALQAFANNSTSLYQARSEGYVDDVLSSPLRPWQLTAAYAAGGFVRGLLAAAAVAVAALPFTATLERPAVALAAIVLTALVFSCLGVAAGIWAETFDQHAFAANLVLTPLALLAGVFYSARTLDEPWRTLTRLDPLLYLVDAARAGLTGFHETSLAASLGGAALLAAASFAGVTALVARGWRLKP